MRRLCSFHTESHGITRRAGFLNTEIRFFSRGESRSHAEIMFSSRRESRNHAESVFLLYVSMGIHGDDVASCISDKAWQSLSMSDI